MANKTLDKMNWPLMLITLGVSWEWFKGGWGKLAEGEFVDGLAKTLGFFASKNPNLWVKDFLVTVAIPNSVVFGNMVIAGELAAGFCLFIGTALLAVNRGIYTRLAYYLLVLGFGVGLVLSLTFWLAAGWTSPSTDGLNFVLAVVEAAGLAWVAKELLDR